MSTVPKAQEVNMKDHYTLEEAMQVLGKPRSTFLRDVKIGLIPFELEKGKSRGRVYPKKAIDTLAEIQQQKQRKKEITNRVFSPSTPADIWQEVVIGTKLYGEDDIVSYKTLIEWREINDEMYMSVKEGHEVVAYSCLMPIEEKVITSLVNDEIREQHIPYSSIKQWTDPNISIYISSLTVKPSNNSQLDIERAVFLIRHTIKWGLSLHRQFDIKNWYGIGATKEGQKFFESLGFTHLVSLHNGNRKGYILDDIKQTTRVVRHLLNEMTHGPTPPEKAEKHQQVTNKKP
jgi:hypothetical protein